MTSCLQPHLMRCEGEEGLPATEPNLRKAGRARAGTSLGSGPSLPRVPASPSNCGRLKGAGEGVERYSSKSQFSPLKWG